MYVLSSSSNSPLVPVTRSLIRPSSRSRNIGRLSHTEHLAGRRQGKRPSDDPLTSASYAETFVPSVPEAQRLTSEHCPHFCLMQLPYRISGGTTTRHLASGLAGLVAGLGMTLCLDAPFLACRRAIVACAQPVDIVKYGAYQAPDPYSLPCPSDLWRVGEQGTDGT